MQGGTFQRLLTHGNCVLLSSRHIKVFPTSSLSSCCSLTQKAPHLPQTPPPSAQVPLKPRPLVPTTRLPWSYPSCCSRSTKLFSAAPSVSSFSSPTFVTTGYRGWWIESRPPLPWPRLPYDVGRHNPHFADDKSKVRSPPYPQSVASLLPLSRNPIISNLNFFIIYKVLSTYQKLRKY